MSRIIDASRAPGVKIAKLPYIKKCGTKYKMKEGSAPVPGGDGARMGDGNRPNPMMRAVCALGIAEIIAWGTTFYALGVLGRPIAAETGWSQSLVFGGMTVALLTSSVVSTWIGQLIDRYGARPVMVLGLLLCALGLSLVAVAGHEWAYLASWVVLGPAMRMSLYEAAAQSPTSRCSAVSRPRCSGRSDIG